MNSLGYALSVVCVLLSQSSLHGTVLDQSTDVCTPLCQNEKGPLMCSRHGLTQQIMCGSFCNYDLQEQQIQRRKNVRASKDSMLTLSDMVSACIVSLVHKHHPHPPRPLPGPLSPPVCGCEQWLRLLLVLVDRPHRVDDELGWEVKATGEGAHGSEDRQG